MDPSRAKPSRVGQSRAESDRAEPSRTEPSRVGQSRVESMQFRRPALDGFSGRQARGAWHQYPSQLKKRVIVSPLKFNSRRLRRGERPTRPGSNDFYHSSPYWQPSDIIFIIGIFCNGAGSLLFPNYWRWRVPQERVCEHILIVWCECFSAGLFMWSYLIFIFLVIASIGLTHEYMNIR